MGVQLREILEPEKIEMSSLVGKTLAIDAMNALYQFVSTIRQTDGTPLMDSRGRITSHLSGVFYRTIKLLELGIKPVYVFDGRPPELKSGTIEGRKEAREEAAKKWEAAREAGAVEEARIYAQASAKVTSEMVSETMELLGAMGVGVLRALGEGEAEAARMCSSGLVDATASQDYDSLLFGSNVLVRNLNIVGRRKVPRKNIYVEVTPERILLERVLSSLGISREQLVYIGLLVGTDYNPGGVRGIGPKKAIALVRKHGSLKKIMAAVDWPFDVEPQRLVEEFLSPSLLEDPKWEVPQERPERVREILVERHDFSEERVSNGIAALLDVRKQGEQKNLSSFF